MNKFFTKLRVRLMALFWPKPVWVLRKYIGNKVKDKNFLIEEEARSAAARAKIYGDSYQLLKYTPTSVQRALWEKMKKSFSKRAA